MPEITLAGFGIVFLTASTVQALKEWFSLEGKAVTGISFIVGVAYAVLAQLVNDGTFANFSPYVNTAVLGIVFGLNAAGFWKLAGEVTGTRA